MRFCSALHAVMFCTESWREHRSVPTRCKSKSILSYTKDPESSSQRSFTRAISGSPRGRFMQGDLATSALASQLVELSGRTIHPVSRNSAGEKCREPVSRGARRTAILKPSDREEESEVQPATSAASVKAPSMPSALKSNLPAASRTTPIAACRAP